MVAADAGHGRLAHLDWLVATFGAILLCCWAIATPAGAAFGAGTPHGQSVSKGDDDPLLVVIRQYSAASDAMRSRGDRAELLRFYEDWRLRIAEALKANPSSPYRQHAKRKLLALSNGLGDWEASAQILSELAGEATEPAERLQLHMEMGWICESWYFQTKDAAHARRGVVAGADALQEYEKIPPEKRRDRDHSNAASSLGLRAKLYGEVLGDHAQAAREFRRLREMLVSLGRGVKLDTAGYDLEAAANGEMKEWLAAGQPAKAEEALEVLAGQRGMRWPPSFYALRYAEQRYPQGGPAFQAFLENWLGSRPEDSRTPFLRFRLGVDYFGSRQYERAEAILRDLKDNQAEVLLKADAAAGAGPGQGGYYFVVLSTLLSIALERGEAENACRLAEELKALYPNHPEASRWERVTLALAKTPPLHAWSLWRMAGLALTAAAVAVALGAAIWRKVRPAVQRHPSPPSN